MPAQLVRADADAGVLLVTPGEPAGETAPGCAHHGPQRAGDMQGWLGEQQSGDRDVMGPWRQQGGAPVQDGDLFAVGQEVERVQVAVADDLRSRRRRMAGQPRAASARSARS